ncbi:hypothetical protein ACQR1I_36020 [Bradyrhizobium sp. HKCCYLS2038]|uniref:hypothetical protein n=1 Tax=Bradyrhizobium sp. HKCCYLS2038 TaxID=3420764 RepID=UPI003EBD0959
MPETVLEETTTLSGAVAQTVRNEDGREYVVLKPQPGSLAVECPHCHQQVSETRCTEHSSKDCYNYVVAQLQGRR